MVLFTTIQFLDVVKVNFLSLDTAHLFPNAEAFVQELLVECVGASHQAFLC